MKKIMYLFFIFCFLLPIYSYNLEGVSFRLNQHISSIKTPVKATASKAHFSALKTLQQTPQLTPSALQHIRDRHWHNAPQGTHTSHFFSSMTVQKLKKIATVTFNKGVHAPSLHGQGRHVHEYIFKRPIGINTKHQKAYTLRLITDSNQRIITAFPL